MNTHHTPRESGFSLIEVVTALAVMAVLSSMGAFYVGKLIDSVRLTSQSNELHNTLMLARSEAIKRNSRVTVCKSSTGLECAKAGDWDQGWIVFHDVNNNAAVEPDEQVVQRIQSLPGRLRLRGNGTIASYVSYEPTGRSRTVGGGFQAGTLTLCQRSGGEAREIIINNAGRPRVEKTAASCV